MPSFFDFLSDVIANPTLLITVFLTLGVIFVNGWTDAPNAIATCVSTRAIPPKPAIVMAAVFNFFGVFVMTLVNKRVAQTVYNMVDFGGNPDDALTALAPLFRHRGLGDRRMVFRYTDKRKPCADCRPFGRGDSLQGGLGGINGSEW